MTQTLYWHDYETFGLDPQRDRPAQFAGVRTDDALNVIEDPLVIYCKLADDYLPQPEACLVTGISPQLAISKGVVEAEFISRVHQQIARPGTCTLGYNTIRFDDEVTRNALYRNFIDPYGREWQNGNSRWDLIDLVRAARALRPEGIMWPTYEDGKPSLRLEDLTSANDLQHDAAHDALSDVYATIAFARLLKKVQPKLYRFCFEHRSKNQVLSLLKLGSNTPVLHVSGMYSAEKGCIAVVLPLGKHPTNNNGVLVYDLSVDPEPLLTLPAEEIQYRIFTATEDLPDGTPRIPIKTVHVNKCPFIAPLAVLRPQDADRLQIDPAQWGKNLDQIRRSRDLPKKLAKVFDSGGFANKNDPDLMIYSGGFFSEGDKAAVEVVKNTAVEELSTLKPHFKDQRLPEMLFRYRARNYPESLTFNERQRWQAFCTDRLTNKQNPATSIVAEDYLAKIADLKHSSNADNALLAELESYAHDLLKKLQ